MENSSSKKIVVFHCRKIKSLSAPKMNQQQKEAFIIKNIPNHKNLHLNISKKRRSEPSYSEIHYHNQNIGSYQFQESRVLTYQSCNEYNEGKSSKTTQKRQRNNIGGLLQKIEEKQERILSILQSNLEDKQSASKNKKEKEKEKSLKKFSHQMQKSCQKKKNKLRIRQVLCEKINQNTKNIQFQEKKKSNRKKVLFQMKNQNQTKIQRENLPPFLAKILLEAFGSSKELPSKFSAEENLKTLVSLRFLAHQWTFSDFLQKLLDYDCEYLTKGQIKDILVSVPFLMNEDLFQKALTSIFAKKPQQQNFCLPISEISDRMRKYIENYPRIIANRRETQVKELKKFLASKKTEIVKKIEKHVFQENCIDIRTLEFILLQQFRLHQQQIWLLLANISTSFNNLLEIPYKKLTEQSWINNLV